MRAPPAREPDSIHHHNSMHASHQWAVLLWNLNWTAIHALGSGSMGHILQCEIPQGKDQREENGGKGTGKQNLIDS